MSRKNWKYGKITVVGAGAVGSTFAYSLAQSGQASEIAMVDQNKDLAQGQVLDLAHGYPFYPPVSIHVGDKEDYADSQVIVITAGAGQKPGETRLDLLQKNSKIMESIVDDILEQNSDAVLLVVTNPVDVLTQVALKRSGFDRTRVIGSGTVLDTSRFRYLLSEHCGLDVRNVHAYILGEHGDSEVAPWSMVHLAGMPIDDYCATCKNCGNFEKERKQIVENVKNSAYHIIGYKGATYYAVGLAMVRIVSAILRDQRSVLTISIYLQGEYGIEDIVLSVPCIVSEQGVEKILEAQLTKDEHKALKNSAGVLKEAVKELGK